MMPKSTGTMWPARSTKALPPMHVGVEEAVAEHLVEERLGALLHDGVGIVAGGDDGVAVADRDAVDPLERQHALGGAVPVDGGRAVAGIVGEVLAQLLGGGRLHAQIHLDPHDVGEGAHRSTGFSRRKRGWVRSTSSAIQ